MPRPTKKTELVRLNLEITPATKERLERLQEATESRSMVETISRALAVYETLLQECGQGADVIIRKKSGKELSLMLVPA
jgi:hypothetical protein